MTSLLAVSLFTALNGPQADVRQLTAGSALYERVVGAARAWRSALVGRRFHELVGYEWPEGRSALGKELRDPKSGVYRTLYDASPSVAAFLSRPDLASAGVFQMTHPNYRDSYFLACFALKDRSPTHWPNRYTEIQKLSDLRRHFCLDLVAEGEEWRVSFDFARTEGDSEGP